MKEKAIVIWKRIPIKGYKAKTRIGKAINNSELANQFSECLFENMINNCIDKNYDIYIYHQQINSPKPIIYNYKNTKIKGIEEDNSIDWLRNTERSIKLIYQKGYEKVISTVADVPFINRSIINQVFEDMDNYDIVLLPATDRGVNIYAVNNWVNFNWLKSSNTISNTIGYNLMNDLKSNIEKTRYSYKIYSNALDDIDTLNDVAKLWKALNSYKLQVNNYVLFDFLNINKSVFNLK